MVKQQVRTPVVQRWPQCNWFIRLSLDLRPQARITNALEQGAGIALEINARKSYVKKPELGATINACCTPSASST